MVSCKPPANEIYSFDPRTITGDEISLSEIADDIEYIALDNTFPIGMVYMYKILDSSIYISAKDQGILVFNRKGKFQHKIGTPGRGPGEYHYFMNFDVDPESRSVYIKDGNTIKVYDVNGQFQRSISLNEYDWRFDNLTFFQQKLFVSEAIYQGAAKYSWLVLDTNGLLLSKKYNSIPTFDSNLPSNEGTYLFNDNLHYWEQYNDTVFLILPDLTYKASFLISPGEYRWPKSRVTANPSNLDAFTEVLKKHLSISGILETRRFIIIRYYYIIPAMALIEKNGWNIYLHKMSVDEKNISLAGGIPNDLDAGINFIPEEYYLIDQNREFLTKMIYPSELKSHVATNDFLNLKPRYPDKKHEIQRLANNLKVTDNPVLMLVRLKE